MSSQLEKELKEAKDRAEFYIARWKEMLYLSQYWREKYQASVTENR